MSIDKCLYNTKLQCVTRGLRAFQRDLAEDGLCNRDPWWDVPNLCITLLSSYSLLHTWLIYSFFLNSKNCPQWEERLRDRYRNYPSEIGALGSCLVCLTSVMALMAILTRLDTGSLSGAKEHIDDGREALAHYTLLGKLQMFNEHKRPAKLTYTRTENSSNKSHSDLHITTQGCAWSTHMI